jgi:hypothetical protein
MLNFSHLKIINQVNVENVSCTLTKIFLINYENIFLSLRWTQWTYYIQKYFLNTIINIFIVKNSLKNLK